MSTYEAWRITYQSSEAAARAAYDTVEKLHAQNVDLKAEIEALQSRVQELGEMARENRSKKVIGLEGRIAELEAQLSAIGAGGVEPLRKHAAAPQAAVPETREALGKRLIADVKVANAIATVACQRVAELPDRDSPADWPEAMLVTGDELHMIVREAAIEAQAAPAHHAEGVPAHETCETCQGNGEIVNDWDRYEHPHAGDKGDEAVSPCQDCEGTGEITPAHPAEGVPAQTTRDAVIQHLTNAGVLEHDGCGIFIASGDASELIDACMALSTHAHHEKGAAAQAVQDAVPEAREALAKRLIADVQVAATIATAACQRVAELPDRASPADWPEAMLVTGDELHMIVREAVIEAQTAPAHPAEGVPAQGGTPGPWRVRKRTNDVGEVLDCFVTAPDCQGRAYDAHILGDDYDSIDLKLADAELVVAAVNAFRATATQPAAQGMDARDAAFEAVRKAFCKLQRYSFFLDGAGNVRRCADHCGNWVEFDAVHTLFEPQSVDAAIAAQAKQGGADHG